MSADLSLSDIFAQNEVPPRKPRYGEKITHPHDRLARVVAGSDKGRRYWLVRFVLAGLLPYSVLGADDEARLLALTTDGELPF